MTKTGSLWTVTPSGSKDDSPYMMDAFKQCGQNGQIEVTKGDYTIAKVMDVLNLKNCDISIRGKLTWSDDIQYWVKNSVGVTHTFVAYSQNVTMTNLDMNATSSSQWGTVNTDGFDSWNSQDIVLKNWVVTCGDDCISVKGNSKNIYVKNATCYESGAMVIGSMGNPTERS
ncbi:unnamed protein product [Alternaria alternata]